MRLLLQVERRPGISLSALASHLGVSRPSGSVLVDRLVRAGFLERGDDPTERRRISIRITPLGKAAVKSARHGAQEWLIKELEKLSDRQVSDLESAIRILEGIAPSSARDG